LYRTEDTSVGRNLEHLSNNVYLSQGHLRPLFFWPWLLQIDLFLVIVVIVIFIIVILIAEGLASGTLEPLDRLRENLVGNGNTQLLVVTMNMEITVSRCGEIRLTSM